MKHSKDRSIELVHAHERALVVIGHDGSVKGDVSLKIRHGKDAGKIKKKKMAHEKKNKQTLKMKTFQIIFVRSHF